MQFAAFSERQMEQAELIQKSASSEWKPRSRTGRRSPPNGKQPKCMYKYNCIENVYQFDVSLIDLTERALRKRRCHYVGDAWHPH